MNPTPPTHRVVVRYTDGRPYSVFTSHDVDDAARFLAAVCAANRQLVGEVTPVVHAKPMPDGLRKVA